MSLVSFIIAMVLWFMLVCTLVYQNMGVLKKPFYLEYAQKGNRRTSCSSICIIAALLLTIFSMIYAICIANQIYDQTTYADQYEKERQKKLRQLRYKFYSAKITDAEKSIYDKLSLSYSVSRYQPQCTIDDYAEYSDVVISDIFLGDTSSITLLRPSTWDQIRYWSLDTDPKQLEYLSLFKLGEESDMKTVVVSGKKGTQTCMYTFGILLVLAMVTFVVCVYAAVSHYTYQDSLQMVRVYVKPCANVFLVRKVEKGRIYRCTYTPLSQYALNKASIRCMSKRYFKKIQRQLDLWYPKAPMEEEGLQRLIETRPEFVAIVIQDGLANSVIPAYCEVKTEPKLCEYCIETKVRKKIGRPKSQRAMINNWSEIICVYAVAQAVLFSALITVTILNFKWIASQ